MSNFLATLLLAFIIIAIALASLGIGWLITGKSKLKAGACGRDPTKKKDGECGSRPDCQLCDKPAEKKKTDEL